MSSFTGEPIDVLTVAFPRYLPLSEAGRFDASDSSHAVRFRCKSSSEKFLLPILFMTKHASLTLYSIRPCFDYLTYSISSFCFTSVPDFTLGMSPLGPRIRAYFFRVCIYSGVAMILSNSILPSLMSFRTLSSPITSAPLFLRSS